MSWTADGKSIVVRKQMSPNGDAEIYRMPVDGGNAFRLDLPPRANNIAIHPGGRKIAFQMPRLGTGAMIALENALAHLNGGK